MSQETSNLEHDADRRHKLLAAYGEVCRSYHAVDDFRAKLLAALPVVSGAGGILLLGKAGTESFIANYLGYIGLFGFVVTVGLLVYECRGLCNCGSLIKTGKRLEMELELGPEERTTEKRTAKELEKLKLGQFQVLEGRCRGWLPIVATAIVYGVTLVGWIIVARVGCRSPNAETGLCFLVGV